MYKKNEKSCKKNIKKICVMYMYYVTQARKFVKFLHFENFFFFIVHNFCVETFLLDYGPFIVCNKSHLIWFFFIDIIKMFLIWQVHMNFPFYIEFLYTVSVECFDPSILFVMTKSCVKSEIICFKILDIEFCFSECKNVSI